MRIKDGKWISLAALVLSLLFLCGCSFQSVKTDAREARENEHQPDSSTVPEQTQPEEISVTDLLKSVLTLKADLKQSAECLLDQDPDGADACLASVEAKTDTIRRSLEATLTNLGDSMPTVAEQLENIQDILNLVDALNGQILQPAADMLRTHPLDGLTASDEGICVTVLGEYLDFAESLMPAVEELVSQAETVDLSIADSDGDLTDKLELAKKLVAFYQQNPSVFSALKAVLGTEGDRTYLLAAQNTAEIRASGGFPGSMGVLRIQDGLLTIQDFEKVYDVLASDTPIEAKITGTETSLFHGGLSAPRDAVFCPDFERVAYIWSLGYEAKQGETLDGVISMTPVIVQRLLDAIDGEVTLSDGTVMNGSNACRVLQYDLYYKYAGNKGVVQGNTLDELFAEAAKETMRLLTENLSGEAVTNYLDVMMESLDDRTLMFWMEDETEQALICELGWSGGLNSDPENPEAGVYVNCIAASKMGIFLEMDTEIGERTLNSDGSYTFPITVKFHNSMTKEEIDQASSYITGGSGGYFSGSAYFFAPADGTIGNFAWDGAINIEKNSYHDLQMGILRVLNLAPGASLTITYDVATAPGVETALTISKTPTLQAYR